MKCPLCDAKGGRADLYCGRCGSQLPTARRGGGRIAAAAVIVSAAVAIVACAVVALASALLAGGMVRLVPEPSPTPAPLAGIVWLTYESRELGVSVRYPRHWFMKEDLASKYAVFVEEEEDLQVDTFLEGTSFVLGPTEDMGMPTAEAVLRWAGVALPEVMANPEIGHVEPHCIGGEEGAWMTIQGDAEGVLLRGWIAVAVADGQAYALVAVATDEDWEEQRPLLLAMLDSVELSPPAPAVLPAAPRATPSATPPLPSPTPGPDASEPDDSIGRAGPIATDGAPQAHSLHEMGDRDYVSFRARAGEAYTVETLNLGAEIDTIVYLYDEHEEELVHDDDGGEGLRASRLIWVAPASGTYYVMIRDLGGDSAGTEATYSVRVTSGSAMEGADQYEPDETFAQAGPIGTDGRHQTHTFHLSADVDYVSFVAQQGVQYTIQTGNLGGGCDTRIFLYDETGQELDYDDDSADETLASRLVWTATAGGTYYIVVEEFRGRAGPGVSYDIWMSN